MRKVLLLLVLLSALIAAAVPASGETYTGDTTITRTLTLLVNQAPSLTVSPSTTVTVTKGGTAQIIVSADKAYEVTWTTDNLPDWLSVSTSGDTTAGSNLTLTGTPAITSTGGTFTVTASNDKGTASVDITVNVAGHTVSSDLIDTSDNTFTGEQTSRDTTTST